MATKDVATVGEGEVVEAEIVNYPEIRVSPDGQSVAIRTIFEDTSLGQVTSWLAVSANGISTYMTADQVSKWTKR